MKKYQMNKSDSDALKQQVQLKNGVKQFKVGAVAAAITSLICASIPSFAADLEIYVPGNSSQGATTIMFLLDISGSMDTRSIEQDYGRICNRDWRGGTTFEGDATNGQYCVASGNEITDQIKKDCDKFGSAYKCFDRISRLRQGMLAVLEGDTAKGVKRLDDDLVIGLSTLGAYTTTYHETGAVKVPARALSENVSGTSKTQREILIEEVKKLRGQTNTPTTRSYAEVVAYLMGKTTQISGGEWYFGGTYNWKDIFAECVSMAETGSCLTWGGVYYGKVPSGFTKGTAKTVNGYSGNVYTTNNAFSGFGYSSDLTKNSGKTAYLAPTTISRQISYTDDEKKCSGQGVYVLTDGVPNYGNGTSGLIRKALGSKGAGFECTDSGAGWNCTLNLASALLDSTKNPANISFKTAVVGFGSDFNTIASSIQTEAGVDALTGISDDIKQAAKWGIRGRGGWYSGSNAKDVAESIADFVDKSGGEIPSISTGSSTVPMDALNPEVIQKYAYFPQFEPKVKPSDSTQLWFGNLKKYYVVNGGVYADENGTASQTVVLKSKLQNLTDLWAKSGVTYPENAPVFSKGGVLSQLLLGLVTTTNDKNESTTSAGRKLLTNYVYDGSKAEDEKVSQDFDLKRIDYTYTTDTKTKTDNAARVRGLMTLLGYNISAEKATEDLDLTSETTSVRQMGSVYHSLPVLLTQEGKAVATQNKTTKKVEISSIGRKDYVMFGTTQGLLSVVDATTGIEKFSFVPKEMIENQAETFRENAGNLTGGKDALYYGIDGEWVAHTVYVTKSDGTLTVNGTVRDVVGGSKEDVENLKGKQWVYGGLRMGGRSYYSMDLTQIDRPKLKFHIDPTTGRVYSKENESGKAFKAIENMAQSWSKPKLDYVNWKGQRKLVMFVGGGYDAGGDHGDGLFANNIRTGYAGYEHYNYVQENKKGSGVYMFDADNGDLLWYADSADTSSDTGVEHASNANLKYSVASDIKTVDRNNDGIVDHLYFGDLAGQAFRVDFKNDGKKDGFDSQIAQVLNLQNVSGTETKYDGVAPRFYMSPVFTAHHSAGKKEGANIIVVSFVSGNKSSPLLATDVSPLNTGKRNSDGLVSDAVYAIYDYDIHPDGTFYPQEHIGVRTLAEDGEEASTNKLKYISNNNIVRSDSTETLVLGAEANATSGWGGWYYPFKKKFNETLTDREDASAGIIKGLTPLIAMEGNLYVTQYDASEDGTSSACGAGVKGNSFTQRLCLPTGVCPQNANYVYNLGAGIVHLNVGPYGEDGEKTIVVPDPADIGVGCVGSDCQSGSKFITAGGVIRFIPNRWYERYAKAE
ncbi:hypothetical protein DJ533_17275 [Acinetobacter defluvii]|uniref:Pilus assembly protein PilY n=1 Tax=Acinetobacter defluvii TaxID=1871111 RepID=A0A2S2FH09_9GAMM|nr:hypothetical protein [Acinetobacter defluvii]AWL30188.1 hypothetical protein DJ533_17275 [Acinetobacter defluvii]